MKNAERSGLNWHRPVDIDRFMLSTDNEPKTDYTMRNSMQARPTKSMMYQSIDTKAQQEKFPQMQEEDFFMALLGAN